jgi:hypothetical protein
MREALPITLFALCSQIEEKPDPASQLGTVADFDDLEDRTQPDTVDAVAPICPIRQTVTTPSGPRIDPVDPWGIQTLTFLSDPRRPGYICEVSCLLSTSQCWLSSAEDCHDSLPIPSQFPKRKRGESSNLYVCVAASLASPIPLRETVSVITSNDLDNAVSYMVKGAD